MDTAQTIYAIDLFGVAVFAVSGSLAAGRKKMDIFGVIVLGLVTALGGGTLRDMLLDTGPVFWIDNPFYLVFASASSMLTFFAVRIFRVPGRGLVFSDAFGLAVFTALGTANTLDLIDSPTVAAVMGIMTGVAGGIIRDILSAEIPLILRKEVYATAALCGAVVYILMNRISLPGPICLAISIAATLVIRIAAIHWNFTLPVFVLREGKEKTETENSETDKNT